MALKQVQIRWQMDAAGALNPALVTFASDNALTMAETLAQTIAYCYRVCTEGQFGVHYIQQGRFQGARVRAGGGAWTEALFPTAEFTLLRAADDALPLPGWGVQCGGAGIGSIPLGTSICVNEQTIAGGRHNGRHYLPWTGETALDTGGNVNAACAANIVVNYGAYILTPSPAAPIKNYVPAVISRTGVQTLILAPSIRSQTSKLRSRTR